MDQVPAQNPNQNQNPIPSENNRKYWLIVGAIIVIALVIFAWARQRPADEDTNGELNEEQTEGTPSPTPAQPSQAENPPVTPATNPPPPVTSGDFAAVGTLRESDNPSRGNLLLASDQGNIYIQTSRDFSNLLGTEVTLNAEGSVNSFVFLGFNEKVQGASAVGGPAEGDDLVNVSGRLEQSDNSARGNYVIISSAGKVYLQTQWDRSAWIGSEVTLEAFGTLQSFTDAVLIKK